MNNYKWYVIIFPILSFSWNGTTPFVEIFNNLMVKVISDDLIWTKIWLITPHYVISKYFRKSELFQVLQNAIHFHDFFPFGACATQWRLNLKNPDITPKYVISKSFSDSGFFSVLQNANHFHEFISILELVVLNEDLT